MIRFVEITWEDGSEEVNRGFCFLDTVTDDFCYFGCNRYWQTMEEFTDDYDGTDLKRYLDKIPEEYSSMYKGTKTVVNLPPANEFNIMDASELEEMKKKYSVALHNLKKIEKLASDVQFNQNCTEIMELADSAIKIIS